MSETVKTYENQIPDLSKLNRYRITTIQDGKPCIAAVYSKNILEATEKYLMMVKVLHKVENVVHEETLLIENPYKK